MTNQTTNHKSFILHKDSLSVLKKLTKEEAGELFLAIYNYQFNKELPKNNFIAIIFEPFLNQFKIDEENRQKVREARIYAGSKGGKQKVAKGSKCKQKVANASDNIKLEFKLPTFINKNLFDAFIEMRKKIKKPLTEKAKELIIKKLTEFENKKSGEANISLENSIANCWQGVFEPKPNNQSYQNNYITKEERTRIELQEFLKEQEKLDQQNIIIINGDKND